MNTNYFKIINKYIKSPTLEPYITHVTLVTNKALKIARSLNLGDEQLRFIEEAGMLHDIGIIKVSLPELNCTGELEYIQHIIEGNKILIDEGLHKHARVALTHIGTGLTREDIILQKLSLPHVDILPETIEEKIICYADLFFGKKINKLFVEATVDDIRNKLTKYKGSVLERFEEMYQLFQNT